MASGEAAPSPAINLAIRLSPILSGLLRHVNFLALKVKFQTVVRSSENEPDPDKKRKKEQNENERPMQLQFTGLRMPVNADEWYLASSVFPRLRGDWDAFCKDAPQSSAWVEQISRRCTSDRWEFVCPTCPSSSSASVYTCVPDVSTPVDAPLVTKNTTTERGPHYHLAFVSGSVQTVLAATPQYIHMMGLDVKRVQENRLPAPPVDGTPTAATPHKPTPPPPASHPSPSPPPPSVPPIVVAWAQGVAAAINDQRRAHHTMAAAVAMTATAQPSLLAYSQQKPLLQQQRTTAVTATAALPFSVATAMKRYNATQKLL
jgi:hypothetical protein